MGERDVSEKKRIQSLQEKRHNYKIKEQLVRDALQNLDSKKPNKKVVFSEDFEGDIEEGSPNKKRKVLFEDEEEDHDGILNSFNNKLKIKGNANDKLARLQARFANDPRFTLDERFLEDNQLDAEETYRENNKHDNENNEEYDLEKEKEWQFDILESVLGAPVVPKSRDSKVVRKPGMIRYDPTENKHRQYELPMDQTETVSKSKKKKHKTENEEIEEPVPVSKDIYYSVSDKLSESLKQQEGGFSLLKAFGKRTVNIDETENEQLSAQPLKKRRSLNFNATNPFKYDSTDDEDDFKSNKEASALNSNVTKKDGEATNLFRNDDTLFFSINDTRFNEAFNFFKKGNVSTENFEKLRRELKQIVRSKIRSSTKNLEPRRKKKKANTN